jgi:hypothetical protein
MGYSYMFRLAIVKIHNFNDSAPEEINKKIVHSCTELYKEDCWFPEFEVLNSSGARGYGSGACDELISNLNKLGKLYPDITFACYLFYDDFHSLSIITFRNIDIISTNELTLEDIHVGKYVVYSRFAYDSIIENEVTKNLAAFEYDDSAYD